MREKNLSGITRAYSYLSHMGLLLVSALSPFGAIRTHLCSFAPGQNRKPELPQEGVVPRSCLPNLLLDFD